MQTCKILKRSKDAGEELENQLAKKKQLGGSFVSVRNQSKPYESRSLRIAYRLCCNGQIAADEGPLRANCDPNFPVVHFRPIRHQTLAETDHRFPSSVAQNSPKTCASSG